MTVSRTVIAHLFSVVMIFAGSVSGQTYPTKPVRIIAAAAPGGSDDFVSRTIAQGLTEVLRQQVIVENRGGGGGLIAREFVARSAPDGYTLLLGGSSIGAIPALRPSSKLDGVRDYSSISLVARLQYLLVVHPSVPAKSVKELIALAKAQPARLTYASSGVGQGPFFAAEIFKSVAKVNITHVPYQGASPAFVDILAGRVDMMFAVIVAALQQVRASKVRPLGVTGAKRSIVIADLPTIAEAGLPGYEASGWYGIMAPAGTNREIVSKLNDAIQKVLQVPESQKRLLQAGLEVETSTPEQLHDMLRAATERFSQIIRQAGIKGE